jgi:hypothetical protein
MMNDKQLDILYLFSHPVRVKMMTLMGQRPHQAQEMVQALKTSYGIVNQNIHILRSQNLVDTERIGWRKAHHWLRKEALQDALAAFVHEARLEIPDRETWLRASRSKKPKKKKKKKAPARKRARPAPKKP